MAVWNSEWKVDSKLGCLSLKHGTGVMQDESGNFLVPRKAPGKVAQGLLKIPFLTTFLRSPGGPQSRDVVGR